MRENDVQKYWNAELVNFVVGLLGVVLILIAVLVGMEKTVSILLASVGTSMLASAVVASLTSRYLVDQNRIAAIVEKWGLGGIFEARSEINPWTNKALRKAKSLDICAMGLKGLRDAQGKTIAERVSKGMKLRILTIDPDNPVLEEVDKMERAVNGYTKNTIEDLTTWVSELKGLEIQKDQVQMKFYNHYPYEFYFNIDGVVYVGPYQDKTSQQTITFKFNRNSKGAKCYNEYFERLWTK